MITNTTERATDAGDGAWLRDDRTRSAARLSSGRRRSVPYLLLGLLLVLVCAGGSVLIWLHAGDRRVVLALARSVPVGHVLTAADLRQVTVALDPGIPVVDAAQVSTVVGRSMSTSLPAGSLLTPGALGNSLIPADGQAVAALALKPGQVPAEVSPGARVSVVFVPGELGPGPGVAAADQPNGGGTVWPGVVISVAAAPDEPVTVVSVQLAEAAARQVAAVPSGQLSLVLLPPDGGR